MEHGTEHGTQRSSPSRDLFAESMVLPVQLFPERSRRVWESERRLMLAIVEEAVHSFGMHCAGGHRGRSKVGREAEEWLFADDRSWCFSFVNICDVLDLDPGAVREALDGWKGKRAGSPPRFILSGAARHRRQA